MKLKYIIYTLIIVVLGSFVFYRISKNNESQNANNADKGPKMAAQVSGMVLQAQDFDDNLAISGSIEANEQIELRSEVSGIIEQIHFQEGSNVQQGQLLFKVNDIELRADLARVKTVEKLASENQRRAKLLLEKEAISQEEFDIAAADYYSAKAQTQLIQAQLSKTSVKAPFSGKIGLRNVSKGTYVTPTTLIAKLVNTNQIKITFSVPEKYAAQVKVNNTVNFTTSSSKELFSAKIYAIEPEVDVATRTLKMRAVADNSKGKLLPGTFANVSLPLDKLNDALLVPTEALIPIQNGKKIFISENGNAKEVVVETGARTDKNILIVSGLKVGDTILTTGVMSLREGSPVKVKIVK